MAKDIPWRSVEPVPELNGDVAELLAAIDSLRRVWDENLAVATPDEVEQARKRSLRRHAIETGIIERLYDLDWGVTEALVAEGLTLDVAANEGGLTEDTLAVIRDQYSALDYLAEAARTGHELSVHFIRELHVLITRHQPTYDAQDQFGRVVKVALPHGEWKRQPNSVTREDGVRINFVPPEQVQSEMELLLDRYASAASAHPVVRAAWLHHSFISIHPFADGNGRVARALTLLVLLQAHYAPLVVDRRQRADYIAALDSANEGNLRPLVRFFARLERIALTSALTRPVEAAPVGVGAVDVARAYAERLRVLTQRRDDAQGKQTQALAEALQEKLWDYMGNVRDQFRDAFRAVDPAANATVYQAAPPDERAFWWRAQLVRTANAVDFYSNLRAGSWWTQLRLTVLGQTLRYVVAVQKVGRGETGVLAVTSFAESVENHLEAESSRAISLLSPTPDDSVTLIYTDSADARWTEVCELVDRTLAAAIASFSNGLG
ncbi:Fic family protein [Micromonospora sp. CPCC 206060]|uniref:Fic family protein n=1 Tax=Micromonospora sp. CPCC 206060 TaxID=3122406 RepID=UPI002FEF3147